jgi:hypothetical protein
MSEMSMRRGLFVAATKLAGNNAAALTVAILEEWTARGQPTGAATTA